MDSRFRPRLWLSRIRDSKSRRVQLPPSGCAIGVAALLIFAGSASAAETPPCESAPACHGPARPGSLAPPIISGTPESGQMLTASTGSWTNEPESYAYQWEDCSPYGESCKPIPGAVAATYVVSENEVGQRISVEVSASNAGGKGLSVSSEVTGVIVAVALRAAMYPSAAIVPASLPRSKAVAVNLRLGFTSEALDRHSTPELSRIALDISRNVAFQTTGLPSCPLARLYSSAASASQVCAASLIGKGSAASEVELPGQAAVPINGRLLAFYSNDAGTPRILAQVTSETPLPLTYVIPFAIAKTHGTFATSLVVRKMRNIKGRCRRGHSDCFAQPYTLKGVYGHISKLELFLNRQFSHAGKKENFASADCPARSNLPGVRFLLEKVTLGYSEGPALSGVARQACEISG